ncbi:MAG: glycoside hydrolase family 5 protein, partial [Fibromonadaceae bacterium]|nr:glycoside hydrolase family 5 protein [Fibromonadaceae bacterium]
MKNISRKGKGFFAPTVAAALALATAFTLSCSSNAGLPPPPEDAEGNVFCYIGGIGGTCVEVSAGMCQAASGTKVSSCGTAAGNSSSSASQSESVSCKVGSACELLPKPTCSVLQGTEVTSCGGSNSGTGGGSSSSGTGRSSSSIGNTDNTPPVAGTGGPVAVYGRLKACTISGKGQVCGSGSYASQAVQVKGVSLFWSNTGWGGEKFFTASTINTLVDDWKAEIIRVPIGYAESGGYKTDASNLTRVKTAVNAAIARGVYVIIDWHSHDANNELTAATA